MSSKSYARAKGRRSKSERFARIPKSVLLSEAAKTLRHAPFRILVLLAGEYQGRNNGAIGLTKKAAAEHGIANRTLYAGLKELEARGLIEQTYPASRVPPRPTMYALTWVKIDNTQWTSARRRPANTYRNWAPRN